jgi:hypothetical protein
MSEMCLNVSRQGIDVGSRLGQDVPVMNTLFYNIRSLALAAICASTVTYLSATVVEYVGPPLLVPGADPPVWVDPGGDDVFRSVTHDLHGEASFGAGLALNLFSFEFWTESANPYFFAGDVMARVRLYDNYTSDGYHAPGSCRLDTFWFQVLPVPHVGQGSSLNTAWIEEVPPYKRVTFPVTFPTAGVFWDIEFTGMSEGDALGVNAVRIQLDHGSSPVPEPSTYLAGALMLLPFGLQGVRMLRNRKLAG